MDQPVSPDLAALAEIHGVATWWRDGQRGRVEVDSDVVVAVLGLLGVDASGPGAVAAALVAARAMAAPGGVPDPLVLRPGSIAPRLPGPATLVDEAGTRREIGDTLPADLPIGGYTLELGERRSTVLVAPAALPEPPRTWGWMLQLYAVHSAASWGIGDLGDLRELVEWTRREHDAGVVLVNPLHAVTPVEPIEPSPYLPSSRRFADPLSLRVRDVPGYADLPPDVRAEVDALRPPAAPDRIDHDAVWRAKRAALELIRRAGGAPATGLDEASPALRDFATFCAVAERHGPRWTDWPAGLRHPDSAATARARTELADRVAFHAWVQAQCARQLDAVQAAAAGMPVGVVHDLAVGVDPQGADAWSLQDVLASTARIGAPPDGFNSHGQEWGLLPWRPDALRRTGFAAYRDLLRSLLAHADGLRIDHVMGLWRLWWVPPGESPRRGTYVRYDADAMLAVLAIEAHRAGAVVVGENLGIVEPEVTATLDEQRMLGTSVLWFARDEDAPGQPLLPARRWPERAAASISTHDLPTAPGFLRGEHVRVRAELGLIDDVAAERARAEAERRELLDLLRAEGVLGTGEPSDDEIVRAMHAFLARTPSRLRLISPYDVGGVTAQPNLPGTLDEYPNWRLPLPFTFEELRADPRVAAVVAAVRGRPAEGG